MSEKLKPCPVCGERGDPYCGIDTFFIECCSCSLQGPHGLDKEEAIAAWNALPRALEWTYTPPTELGWYWMDNDTVAPLIVHAGINYEGQLEVWYGAKVVLDVTENARWAGPIPMPKEPTA